MKEHGIQSTDNPLDWTFTIQWYHIYYQSYQIVEEPGIGATAYPVDWMLTLTLNIFLDLTIQS